MMTKWTQLSLVWALIAISCVAYNKPTHATENATNEVIEEIIVTGSRIKRRDDTAPSPIFTLSRGDFALAPQPTLEETLARMPQITPDFGRTSNNPGDGTARVNLRGMGAERTLVLLNGRRVAPTGVSNAVDLNTIPQILIENIEVITGGASAVYGSDALAGVVNFITVDDLDGILAESRYGTTLDNDAEHIDVNVAFGRPFAQGRGNVTVFAGYYDRADLLAAQRSLTNRTLQESGGGQTIEAGSFATPEAAIFRPVPGLGFPTFNPDGTPRSFVNPDDQYNFAPQTYLQTPLRRYSGGILAHYQLNESTRVYAETTFAENDASTESAPTPATEFVSVNVDNPILTPETRQLLQNNFTNPAGPNPNVATFPVGRRLNELGPRTQDFERSYVRSVAGFESELGNGWSLDGWVSYARSETDQQLNNDASLVRLRQGLLVDPTTGQCFDPSDGCLPIDIFGPNRISNEAVNFIRYEPLTNSTKRSQTMLGLFISGTPTETWAGPLDLVLGMEWRSDRVRFRADDALFTGDTLGYTGDSPISGTERVGELYVELLVPLLTDQLGAHALNAELGARYSDYDSTGGAWTYKGGLQWDINPDLRFRSMWQRSVRAPNNQELFQRQFSEPGNFVGNFTFVDNCSASQDPVANGLEAVCIQQGLAPDQIGVFEAIPFFPVEFVRGGNQALDPEVGETVTLGFVYQPDSNFDWSVSLDYYDIEITDSIGEIDAKSICFDPANDRNAFCNTIERISDPTDPSAGNVFRVTELFNNRGLISTKGADLQARFTANLPKALSLFDTNATITGSLIWTHVFKLRFQNNPVGTIESCVGYFNSPCTGVTSSATGARNRIFGSLRYDASRFSASLAARWISATSSYLFPQARILGAGRPTLAKPRVASQFYADVDFTYRLTNELSLRFSVNNLLNNDAPVIPNASNNTDAQLYDVFGRAYGLTVTYSGRK